MHTPFDAELPNLIWRGNTGRGVYLGDQPRLLPQESGVPELSNFRVLLYRRCPPPTPFSAERTNSAW